jgi:hypothetical protein
MNLEKVEDNVAKFLAVGFRRAGELVNGYPIVYRMQEHDDFVVCREVFIVSEDVTPEACLGVD